MADEPGSTWLRELFRTARLLAIGSLALLLAAFAWIVAVGATTWSDAFTALFLVTTFSGIGVVLHGIAWLRLRRTSRGSVARIRTFRGSVAGFAMGLLTLPWVSWIFVWIFFLPLIPMIPSVFAPVVIAHAVLFSLCARSLTDRRDAAIVIAASGLLVANSVAGLFAQAFAPGLLPSYLGPLPAFILTFAGATAVGYGIIAFGAVRALARAGAGHAETGGFLRTPKGPIEPVERQDSAF